MESLERQSSEGSTPGKAAVAVHSFGLDRGSGSEDFTVPFAKVWSNSASPVRPSGGGHQNDEKARTSTAPFAVGGTATTRYSRPKNKRRGSRSLPMSRSFSGRRWGSSKDEESLAPPMLAGEDERRQQPLTMEYLHQLQNTQKVESFSSEK